jgi:crotonobetainyl-CoA hydratase
VKYQFIDVIFTDDIMEVSIQRPDVLNALNSQAHSELADTFDKFAKDSALNIAVIRGSGERAFCVGSDLKERSEFGSDRMPPSGFAGLTERFDLEKPVIALVNGDAIGGGLEILLACDLAIAVDTAHFGLPEPKVGLAASGGLHRLARQLPLVGYRDLFDGKAL